MTPVAAKQLGGQSLHSLTYPACNTELQHASLCMRRYFGAAKQLPGVRELFEVEAPRQVRRTRHQLYQHINGDYYGFRDEEDGVLEKVEGEAERVVRQKVRAAPHTHCRRVHQNPRHVSCLLLVHMSEALEAACAPL